MMKMRKTLPIAIGLALAVGAVPAIAHHSFSMFDQTRIIPMDSAEVKEFHFTNPHSFIIVEFKGTKYIMECNSVNLMTKAGWRFNTIKSGDKIALDYYPLRDGKPGGMLKTITLANGKTLKAW